MRVKCWNVIKNKRDINDQKNSIKELKSYIEELTQELKSKSKNTIHMSISKKNSIVSDEEESVNILNEKINVLKEENKDLKKQLLELEMNVEKRFNAKLEAKLKEVKEDYVNQNKLCVLQYNMFIQEKQKEKEDLISFYKSNYIENNEFDRKTKEYRMEIEILSKEIRKLSNSQQVEISELNQKVKESESENERLTKEINELKSKTMQWDKVSYITKNSDIENLLKTDNLKEFHQSEHFLRCDFDTNNLFGSEINEEGKINFQGLLKNDEKCIKTNLHPFDAR